MDEEFEKIEVEYAPLCEGHEIDIDYEFDAPQFFFFTRQETDWDASEAEQWFEFAPSYPPSPFLLKTRWGNCSPSTEKEQDSDVDEDNCTDSSNGKTKPLSKSSSSRGKDFSFMKPTASHLAKQQKNLSEVRSPESFRFQRQNSSSTDCQLTKRQKLEAGYLRKAARLKHHILFTHKTKKVDHPAANSASKSNATTAKEPNLVTALRAHRHKSKTSAESGGPTQSSSQELKAKPFHKKILEGPAQILSKTKTSRPTQCQRAMQNTSNNVRSSLKSNSISNTETRDLRRSNSNTVGSGKDKCRTSKKLRGSHDNKLSSKSERGVFRNIKVHPLEANDKESINKPPTELFSKLTLASEVKQTTKSSSKKQSMSKGSKENRPGSFQENEKMKVVKEGMQRSCGKQYQRVNEMGSLISKQTCMLEI